MLKAKVHRLAGKLILSPKSSPKKGLFLAARNLGFLTLGGAVGQTSEYNAWNELSGRSVALKLRARKADEFSTLIF